MEGEIIMWGEINGEKPNFTFHLVGSNFIISTKVKMKMQFILSKTCQYCNNIFDRKSEFTVHIEKNISITKWTGPLL